MPRTLLSTSPFSNFLYRVEVVNECSLTRLGFSDIGILSAAAYSKETGLLRASSHRIRIDIPFFRIPQPRWLSRSLNPPIQSLCRRWRLGENTMQLAKCLLPEYVHILTSFAIADDLEYTACVASVAHARGGDLV